MNTSPDGLNAVPRTTKVILGVVLPVGSFAVFDLLLLNSVAGKGEALGFAGMGLGIASLVIIPAILLINTAIMIRPWRRKTIILLLGFTLPVVAAVKEYLSLYGR